MNKERLTNLPTEIIINILHKLPPKTIISCKCVCNSLFNLLETPDFVKIHLSKSIPGLIFYNEDILPQSFKIFELIDELDLENDVPIAEFDCRAFITPTPLDIGIEGSANGFLFLRDIHTGASALYICNPITREYINLPYPKGIGSLPVLVTCGFGVSEKTNQYKVVGIFDHCVRTRTVAFILKSVCHVYTLGTGRWRSVPHDSTLDYSYRSNGPFLNGKLHWLASDFLKESLLVSCFDLETELFDGFSLPPCLEGPKHCLRVVAVLEDCLCLCANNTFDNEVVIWVMKEYGVEKSWTKEVVIGYHPHPLGESYVGVYPIKVFGDGDILLSSGRCNLVYYSNRTKTTSNVVMFDPQREGLFEARLHVSSFLSLKSFAKENVAKF